MIGADRKILRHNLFLANKQVAGPCKTVANSSLKNVKLSNVQLSKIIQLNGFLVTLLGPSHKVSQPLMTNIPALLAKSMLVRLEFTAAVSAVDEEIHKKPGTITPVISNKEMKGFSKIKKSLEIFGMLIKDVTQKMENETKELIRGFRNVLLTTLGAKLFVNMLAGE